MIQNVAAQVLFLVRQLLFSSVLKYRYEMVLSRSRLLILGTLMVDGVSEGLINEYLLNLINMRVILIIDLYLAGINKLTVAAYCGIRVLIGNHILRVAAVFELVEDDRGRLVLENSRFVMQGLLMDLMNWL